MSRGDGEPRGGEGWCRASILRGAMVGAGGQSGGRETTENDANVSGGPGSLVKARKGKRRSRTWKGYSGPDAGLGCHLPLLGITCRSEVGTAATRESKEPVRTAWPRPAAPLHCLCFALTRPDPDEHVSPDGRHLAHLSMTRMTKLEARSPASLRCLGPSLQHTCLRHARGARSPSGTPPRPGPPWGG